MDMPLTAISAAILLLVLQLSSAAILNPSGQTTPAAEHSSVDSTSVSKAATSHGGGGDLAEALEWLAAGKTGTEQSAKRSAGTSASSSRQSGAAAADKDRTPGGVDFDVADPADDRLLSRLAQIEANVRVATSPTAADGASDEDVYELLDRLLPSLGYKTDDRSGSADAAVPSRQSERRMFTNGGSRGKKEEPSASAGGGGDDLGDIVSELVGAVRELALRYVAQKERTDTALTILAEVVESLVSRRGD